MNANQQIALGYKMLSIKIIGGYTEFLVKTLLPIKVAFKYEGVKQLEWDLGSIAANPLKPKNWVPSYSVLKEMKDISKGIGTFFDELGNSPPDSAIHNGLSKG